MHPLDAAIVLGFATVALASGFRARGEASRSLEEYFLAGRTLKGWQAGASMAATQFAADTPLLVTGLVATAGIFSLWRLWIYALAFLLMGFLLSASWRRAGVLTDAELTELRYAGRAAAALRVVKAVYFGTVFNCVVLAMVLWAAKEIAEPFLLWHAWLPEGLFGGMQGLVHAVGVPFARDVAGAAGDDLWIRSTDNLISVALLVAVTLGYSASGGLRSVVRTDILQLALMLGGTALYAGFVLAEVGGLSGLREALDDPTVRGAGLTTDQLLAFDPTRARDAGPFLLAAFGLQWLVQMNADGTGYLAQRSMACRSDADARTAAVVFTGLQVVLRSLLWLPIALGLLVLYPADPTLSGGALSADREVTFVRGMADLLPVGALGLMLTAMLAALASTIDTHLNWGASYWTNDLYARVWCRGVRSREPEPRELVRVARLSTLGILGLAMFVMTQLDSIQTAWQTSLLLGAGMGVMLVLRWVWWRVTAWGELAAILVSLVLAPVLLLLVPPEREALRLLLMATGATSVGIAVSLLGPQEPFSTLAAFFERARPPGFWSPVAEAGPARVRLTRGLTATVAGALCCFCLLAGLGSALVGSPAPVGWPGGRGLWIAILLLAGSALIPVWWRLGLRPRGEASR